MAWLGIVLHFVLLPVFLASGLVVPGPVVPFLVGLWGGLMIVATKNRDRPRVALAVPLVAMALLVAIISAGAVLFDWTA